MNVLRRPGPVQTVVLCLISIIAMTGTLWVLYSAIQLTSDLYKMPNRKYYDCVREQLSLAIKDEIEIDLSTCKFEKAK